MVHFGEKSLRAATVNFLDHFHTERNHQGMGSWLLIPGSEVDQICLAGFRAGRPLSRARARTFPLGPVLIDTTHVGSCDPRHS